ncbi:MAG: hypothetical protein ACFFDR_14660, partial [Candidatus Thorarchaeota archaeon]
RDLRSHLGIKYQRLVHRLNQLKASDILRDRYDLEHCGLHEALLVKIPDPAHGAAITSWAQRLPYTRIIKGSNDEYLLFLQLPDGGLQGMAIVLQTLSPNLKPMLLDSQPIIGKWYITPGSWNDAVNGLWDEKKQTWMGSEEEVSDWLRNLP